MAPVDNKVTSSIVVVIKISDPHTDGTDFSPDDITFHTTTTPITLTLYNLHNSIVEVRRPGSNSPVSLREPAKRPGPGLP